MAHFTPLDWFWTGSFLLLMVGGAFFGSSGNPWDGQQ